MYFQESHIPGLSLRHLKAALYVARHRNLTHAADELNRSQTAITKAIINLEEQLGVHLFDRSNTGMLPTIYGTILAKSVEQAESEFNAAGRAYLEHKTGAKRFQNIALFSMDISYKRLASLISLYDTGSMAPAAARLGITHAAIYASIRELENLLDIPLFEREPNGFSPTDFCAILVRHIKLVFSELKHAIEDIESINGVQKGEIIIGALPYSRSALIPRAINKLQANKPQLDISTHDAPYEILESLLRNGEIDLIVGEVRQGYIDNSITTETLFDDNISLVVRKGHPLLVSNKKIRLETLSKYGWVLPVKNSPSREIFNKIFEKKPPENTITASSLSTTRGLLQESDRIALLPDHQINYEQKYKILEKLPIILSNSSLPIGITMRRQTQPSPSVSLFLDCLRETVLELPLSSQNPVINLYQRQQASALKMDTSAALTG